jgi:hypothetical protein
MIQFLSNPAYRTIWIIGGGIFLILSALPMLYNCVKPNPWYGFRVPKTLSDERIWYPANSYAAKGMILTGIITIVVAVGAPPNRYAADKVPIVMFFYVLRWPYTDPHHVPDLYKETPITSVCCIESPAQRQYKRARQKAIAYSQSTSQSAVGSGRGG